jgi:hypothetical protein
MIALAKGPVMEFPKVHAVTCSIDPKLFGRFPDLTVGALVVTALDCALNAAGTGMVALWDVRWPAAGAARRGAPLHAYDVDALPSPAVTLRTARPLVDWFVPLGARPSDVPVTTTTLVFAAGDAVLSLAFKRCESRQTCLRPGSTRALFVAAAVTRALFRTAAAAMDDLGSLLAARGAHVAAPRFADATNPVITLAVDAPAVSREA